MINVTNLCERCNRPEFHWANGTRVEYNPQMQNKTAFRANSQAKHEVEGFLCSKCTQALIRKNPAPTA